MKYLIDTNIFLEILLKQKKRTACKKFLNLHREHIGISDFSLHSIGVILFRQKKENIFLKFLNDLLPDIKIISLPAGKYGDLVKRKKKSLLDFDDSYQFEVAKSHNLEIATMDRDFEKVCDEVKVIFI